LAEPSIGTLVASAEAGDGQAAQTLFASLYDELRRVAARELRKQGGMTLSASTLLHEAYVAMASREGTSFPDRARFVAYAARVMRGLIIDHVRSRLAQKRGGQFELTALETDPGIAGPDPVELSTLSDALDTLAEVEPLLAQVVDLRFFCGLTFAEIASLHGFTERTAQRHWERARIFLSRTLTSSIDP
jgi:RNA polymerase sigma factor (TIGR02999 family)